MVQLRGNGRLILRVGDRSTVPTITAFDPLTPLTSSGWPRGMADGFWFAGDDVFGGAALVPGTGELLFMQPQEWDEMAEQRANAEPERVRKVRRADIKRRASIR